ncbi:hypothetical protein ABH931_006582 [Streptacidiphilus sp. MAP12-33]|uniref:hypothetical protein n=1 Tax=Streptacidiphilus sp. MAP12-33 TaxID=3156266 RepID=UPI0035188D21
MGKRLRRITPAHRRQLQCLWAACPWTLFAALAAAGLAETPQSAGDLAIDGAASLGLGLIAVLMIRLYRAGLYLGPQHVRVRSAWRTHTLPRAELVAVTTAPYRRISRPDDPSRSDAIVLHLASGRQLVTPVRVLNPGWTPHPLGPAYDLAEIRRALALLRDGLAAPK